MSQLQLFSNNAISLLQVSISTTDMSITLQPGQGDLFPTPQLTGEFFLITLEDIANPTIREIIKIASRVGDTLIVASSGRGWEQTDALNWAANDTLVDHRITAETIRQAFLQPTPTAVSSDLEILDEGNSLTSQANSLNFVGGGVTVSTVGNNVTVTVPSTAASALAIADESTTISSNASKITFTGAGVTAYAVGSEITVNVPGGSSGGGSGGYEYLPVVVIPTQNESVAVVAYSEFKRGNKFWISMVDPATGSAQSFEILTVIQGLLSSNTEYVTWTKTNRIGYNFSGYLDVTLDVAANQLILKWRNLEPSATVIVSVMRI